MLSDHSVLSLISRRRMLAGLAAVPFAPMVGRAQPVNTLDRPTVLQAGSESYHVHSFRLPSPDEGAAHLIRVAWPKGPVPDGGFPAVYMLDGRAVADSLNEPMLARMAAAGGPAIVTLGADLDQRFATQERTRDYTPPDARGAPVADPRGRSGGQAAAFLSLLAETIIPQVEASAPLDSARRALWGHSYGGLFALYAGFEAPELFKHIVSASPALWWDHADFYQRLLARLSDGAGPDVRLDIHFGEAERARASRPKGANAEKLIAMRDALPEDSHERLAAALRDAGTPGDLLIFPGLSHGESFLRSVEVTLLEVIPGSILPPARKLD
ncbi:hypothetical protein SAMN05421688_1648 [Poseidonocella pacifica]|uniref:Trehalose O-mycolyltransferase n=1 Tax=Poseidonocella pacifica TaxID=871651 RepID=A0A1I0WRU8_9RHOB|nr:alpha/beta hydrolase-fold protein [Poseidonocella pacifica]SFA90716.1 hypothetical protein SAMN05421688_1648 [Poseidonocella pacifica]